MCQHPEVQPHRVCRLLLELHTVRAELLTCVRLHLNLYTGHDICSPSYDKTYQLQHFMTKSLNLLKDCAFIRLQFVSSSCLVCMKSAEGCWDPQERRNRCACQHSLDSDTQTTHTVVWMTCPCLSGTNWTPSVSEPVHSYWQWRRTLVIGLLPTVMPPSWTQDSCPSVPLPVSVTALLVQPITPPGHHYLTHSSGVTGSWHLQWRPPRLESYTCVSAPNGSSSELLSLPVLSGESIGLKIAQFSV